MINHYQQLVSRWRRWNNGLPQGSILVPTLFNLYTYDIPNLKSKKFKFADDLVVAYQCDTFKEGGEILTSDLNVTFDYFKKWRLRPNSPKTEVSSFHLRNREAQRQLSITLDGIKLNHNQTSKYLGVKLKINIINIQTKFGRKSKKI